MRSDPTPRPTTGVYWLEQQTDTGTWVRFDGSPVGTRSYDVLPTALREGLRLAQLHRVTLRVVNKHGSIMSYTPATTVPAKRPWLEVD